MVMHNLKVTKGGLPPLALNATQSKRGQATLPDLELWCLESFSVSLCGCTT